MTSFKFGKLAIDPVELGSRGNAVKTRKDYMASYYQSHKAECYAQARSDAGKARRRALYARKRQERIAYNRAWNASNHERVKATNERSRTRNRLKKRAQDSAWRARNPERARAAVLNAKRANPQLYRMIARAGAQARRARLRAAGAEPVSLKAICARDAMRCHLCAHKVEPKDLSFDHLIPVARHGPWAAWNVMVAHDRCNKRRQTRQILQPETKDAAEAYIVAMTRRSETA